MKCEQLRFLFHHAVKLVFQHEPNSVSPCSMPLARHITLGQADFAVRHLKNAASGLADKIDAGAEGEI